MWFDKKEKSSILEQQRNPIFFSCARANASTVCSFLNKVQLFYHLCNRKFSKKKKMSSTRNRIEHRNGNFCIFLYSFVGTSKKKKKLALDILKIVIFFYIFEVGTDFSAFYNIHSVAWSVARVQKTLVASKI